MNEQPKRARRRTPLLMSGLLLVAVLGGGGWHFAHTGRESTDDAGVEGRVMSVSPRVSGQVARVAVEDNQLVEAGDVLVELDPADFAARLDLARADLAAAMASREGARATLSLVQKRAPADLAQAQGGVATASSSQSSARAAIEQASAELAAAESRRALAETNFARARSLVGEGALARIELDTRQTELDQAVADVRRSRAAIESTQASLSGSVGGVVLAKGRLNAAETGPEQVAEARAAVSLADARELQAEATLDLAELDVSYTTIRAPRRGVVSRRSVEEGQTVSPDRPLLAIVPLDDVWVVANFKEDQLEKVHPGQRASVELDTYGGRKLVGHVASIAGGTGARFALLPPDNATGNFVKVVQRVPVLVRLDEPANLELRPGMSADVTVWTTD